MAKFSGVAPIASAIFLALAGAAAADEKKADAVNVVEGGKVFMRYCALCHGLDGVGNGPLAESLQKLPPDLSRIAERNGGTFPDDKVKEIIERGGVKSHGMMAMLSWGKVFNEEIGPDEQTRVINELAAYIKSLQGR